MIVNNMLFSKYYLWLDHKLVFHSRQKPINASTELISDYYILGLSACREPYYYYRERILLLTNVMFSNYNKGGFSNLFV